MSKIKITADEENIINALKKGSDSNSIILTQERFDNLVDYIMENEVAEGNPKELVWRLCGSYVGLNFNHVVDIYVNSRDYYYTSELVCFVNGMLDQEYLIKKMIETEDLEFIDKTISSCGNAMLSFIEEKYMNKLKKYYDSHKQ